MERDRFGEPLEIGVRVIGDARMEAGATLAIADAGHHPAGINDRADLLIMLIDSADPAVAAHQPRIGESHSVPCLAFINTAVAAEAQAWLGSSSHDLQSVVFFEGPSDLRWEVAQTLAGYLSGCFRESFRRQRAIVETAMPPDYASLVAFAVHPDLQARRLAGRLILAYLELKPAGAETLATSLLASGKVASYPAVAHLLRFVDRADPDSARTLLTRLIGRSPAFLTWLVSRDS